jgi:hypothetical protein
VQTNSNGFLPGAGKLSFPVVAGGQGGADPSLSLYLSVFGQCGGTGNSFAMTCCDNSALEDGHCPGTGTPGSSLLYLPNGTGCVVRDGKIVTGNTPKDTAACMKCTLN